jgi:hypothetical protein
MSEQSNLPSSQLLSSLANGGGASASGQPSTMDSALGGSALEIGAELNNSPVSSAFQKYELSGGLSETPAQTFSNSNTLKSVGGSDMQGTVTDFDGRQGFQPPSTPVAGAAAVSAGPMSPGSKGH